MTHSSPWRAGVQSADPLVWRHRDGQETLAHLLVEHPTYLAEYLAFPQAWRTAWMTVPNTCGQTPLNLLMHRLPAWNKKHSQAPALMREFLASGACWHRKDTSGVTALGHACGEHSNAYGQRAKTHVSRFEQAATVLLDQGEPLGPESTRLLARGAVHHGHLAMLQRVLPATPGLSEPHGRATWGASLAQLLLHTWSCKFTRAAVPTDAYRTTLQWLFDEGVTVAQVAARLDKPVVEWVIEKRLLAALPLLLAQGADVWAHAPGRPHWNHAWVASHRPRSTMPDSLAVSLTRWNRQLFRILADADVDLFRPAPDGSGRLGAPFREDAVIAACLMEQDLGVLLPRPDHGGPRRPRL